MQTATRQNAIAAAQTLTAFTPNDERSQATATGAKISGMDISPFTPLRLCNAEGLAVQVLPYGATVASIHWQGQALTLGYQTPEQWQQDTACIGATAGRYANRIANACYPNSAGELVKLQANQGRHTLHGGPQGYQYQTWQVLSHSDERVVLYLDSANGDQGFPGRLQIWQTVQLAHNDLQINYTAISDSETVVNLTNHCYFNLGDGQQLRDHELQIFADTVIPVDLDGIPTGLPVAVETLALDFRQGQFLAKAFERSQTLPHGLDHCFVPVNSTDAQRASELAPLRRLARLRCGERQLEVHSTQPGLQVYMGCYLNAPFTPYQGICLEAQNWPDAPNRPEFPSARLNAGELYQQQIVYRFF